MEVKTTYTLQISKFESTVLVKLLEGLSDTAMMQIGLSAEEADVIHDAWLVLPSYRDDNEES